MIRLYIDGRQVGSGTTDTGPRGGLEFYISMNRGTSYVQSPDAGTVATGRFSRTDRAGRNSFRFTGIRGHKLPPGSSLLQAAPRLGKQSGKLVSVTFTVIA